MKPLLILIFFILPSILLGQQTADILAKRQSTEEAIKITAALLEEARQKETISLNKLKLINAQIRNRNALIRNIQEESDLLDELIATNTEAIDMIEADLAKMKDEYSSLIRMSQKSKNSNKMLVFIFSSENLNQAYKRMHYMRQYTQQRKHQMEIVNALSDIIDKKIINLREQKQKKLTLIQTMRRENARLENDKIEQDRFIDQLRTDQFSLMTSLREQEKIQEELDRMIAALIAETEDVSNEYKMDAEQKLLASDFNKNKGKLPWPVERGVVINHFGVYDHPLLKKVPVKNNGIDIATEAGSKARAVFPGEVSRIFTISGGNNSIILRHGSFLTVYSNLKDIYVKVGQKIDFKQELGSIYSDNEDGKTILKFQVWEENRKQNPQDWLALF